MIVVSDTSPISYLHQIQRLSLLGILYGEVVIPPAVESELRVAGDLHSGIDWNLLRVVHPRDSEQVNALSTQLDKGESEAIVLALELRADLILIDEASGREAAARLGLRRTGLLGVLLEAKRRGIITSMAVHLDRLVRGTTFRMNPQVRLEVLRLAGESP